MGQLPANSESPVERRKRTAERERAQAEADADAVRARTDAARAKAEAARDVMASEVSSDGGYSSDELPRSMAPGGYSVLAAAAQHVYDKYYSAPYPPPAGDAGVVYCAGWERIGGVERPLHGLANALRKALLVQPVAQARWPSPDCTPALVEAMQVAMLFEECGRQSDNNDVQECMRFRADSCEAFRAYATPANGFGEVDAEACHGALERMHVLPSNIDSIQRVFETCHNLDLFRCKNETSTARHSSQLEQDPGWQEADFLISIAQSAIAATGDRLMSSRHLPFSTRERREDMFIPCSTTPEVCIAVVYAVSLISGAADKVRARER